MLDLNLLEKQLDQVLAKETNESMTHWLLFRRLKNFLSKIGEGTFDSLQKCNVDIEKVDTHKIKNIASTPLETIESYSFAA